MKLSFVSAFLVTLAGASLAGAKPEYATTSIGQGFVQDLNQGGSALFATYDAAEAIDGYYVVQGKRLILSLTVPDGQFYAAALNDNNIVVGQLYPKFEACEFREGASPFSLGSLGGSAIAHDVNNFERAVGEAVASDGQNHAFLSIGGVMTDLGTFGGDRSSAVAINDSGQIAGTFRFNGRTHSFLRDAGGGAIDLGRLGKTNGDIRAVAMNARGQVTGTYQAVAGGNRVFLYSSGKLHNLGSLGGNDAYPWAINDAGDVVGASRIKNPPERNHPYRAFLYQDGRMRDLNTLAPGGGDWSDATGINNRGQITVVGSRRSYLLTPLPVVQIRGPKTIVTLRNKIQLHGSAGAGTITVDYRIGRGPRHRCLGTRRWHQTIKLRPGDHVISVESLTAAGRSAPARVLIIRP